MTRTTTPTVDALGTDVGVRLPVAVHFDDMDPMGLLHNSRYAVLVERAWNNFWRDRGLGGKSGLDGDGFNVIKAFDITFDFPVSELGEYAVHLWMERLGATSATAGYRVCSADGITTYAHGSRTVVRLNKTTLTPTPWSERVWEIARTTGLLQDKA
ncbi:acyl-CoA thioesterase [Planotetraspora sp. A-T 1434]|uniref:acyl-CoA thioesterase n=1 Tax=Planotetraspora sp. A-T 1434 TaxID=2979219 RepID=UPI0021C04B67|nr:acyl-CoA thioesterase [Planotetraspora sp. A-T 1434]MCT9935206.1 acyl-CoA thioesterase [Planotetraspora sp. A-T 1434]